jgi:hypothetical protein
MFRELHGEEAWKVEIWRLATQAILTSPKHEAFWKELTKDLDWLDWEMLRTEALKMSQGHTTTVTGQIPMAGQTMDLEKQMADMLRQQMPGIKSQAQYNAVLAALDAVRLTLNAILTGDKVKEAEGRKALEMTFDVTAKTTEITNKLEEVPEAASGKHAEEFKQPPVQFNEYDVHKSLLTEAELLKDRDSLNAWYASTKDRRDKIVSQGLRNSLMDAIRAKLTVMS